MDVNKFVRDFAAQFDETDISEFSPGTRYRDIDEWSSLMTLAIIAMADDEYGVQLKGEDIQNSQTIEDIFNIVKSRK